MTPGDAERVESGTRGERKRGLDGLTCDELRASRLEWWDESFTRFLLRWIPPDTHHLVDIGCGIGTAAHALLPSLTDATYLGIDVDEERLHKARTLVSGTLYADRVQFQQGHAERLPCGDDSVDIVVSSMTLQHLLHVEPVVAEVQRVLHVAGRFLAIEPDNLSNVFYFDGPLEEVNAAFRRLFSTRRASRRPADIAIGPAVPRIAEQAGLAVIDSRPYAVGRISRLSAAELFDHARRVADIASAQAEPSGRPVFEECLAAIDRAAAATAGDRVGYGGQVVLVFVTVAERS